MANTNVRAAVEAVCAKQTELNGEVTPVLVSIAKILTDSDNVELVSWDASAKKVSISAALRKTEKLNYEWRPEKE